MRKAFAVCGNFEPEVRAVLAEDPGGGPALLAFPATCGRPPLVAKVIRDLCDSARVDGWVEVIGGSCVAGLRDSRGPLTVHGLGQCFHLVAPPALVDHLLATGAYLVTPGWLTHWRARLEQMGIDEATAPALFGESMRRVVLLDTGADPGCAEWLREFAAFVGLPAETVPVGLEHLRLKLGELVSRGRLEEERAESLAALACAQRRAADQAAAIDLLSTLTEISGERQAIERSLDVFQMLFAPRRATFVSVEGGEPSCSVSQPPREVGAAALLARLLRAGSERLVGADGFLLPVKHLGELLGLVEVEGVAAPDHLEGDLALALTVAGISGLAIANARKFERIQRAEKELRAANARLVEADLRKDEFLAVLSHELRNPLAPIRNSVYILKRAAPGGERANRALEVIERQVQHMARLVDDLLDVTRISSGKVHLKSERVELDRIVRGACEDLRELFRASGLELCVSVADEPLVVDGDPTRLAQVTSNLLQNAAKFARQGGRAWLTLVPGGGQAVLQVRDDGAGIERDLLTAIFEPFVQADRTLDRSRGGLGLGLALVKGLVELHGGSVSAESEGPGRGALFTVRLPLEARETRAPVLAPAGERAGPSRRVLVVEDNADAARSLVEALELLHHRVEVAFDGPSGIERAHVFAPDVVLCDIGLPGLDGYGVARAMRADPALRSVYLVALSGYAAPEDVERSIEAGFDLHMPKPPDLEALERVFAGVAASPATCRPRLDLDQG